MCLCVRVYAHNNIMAPVVVVFFSSAFYVFYYLLLPLCERRDLRVEEKYIYNIGTGVFS